ncbi:hypothetical protein KR018_001970 [Drosophila ironensis]|nr:hypothetical protein KR018_001970 [Drosophila ironensis]
MASNMSKKGKSTPMRILWIPGRKAHSKGRYTTTSKHVSYSGPQKKSEVWSLGGTKAQSELIDLPTSDDSSNVLPSSSSLSVVASCSVIHSTNVSIEDLAIISETGTLPATPSSYDSRSPSSPFSETAPLTASTIAMNSPNMITTAEIQSMVRSSLELPLEHPTIARSLFWQNNFLTVDELPQVPGGAGEATEGGLNSSTGTTASVATTSSPPGTHKTDVPAATSITPHTTPQKTKYKNHNNNQEDINSIESLSSWPRCQRNATDFDWIDEMVQQRNCNEMMHKNKRKKSKKVLEAGSEASDHLDGKFLGYDAKEKAIDKTDDNGDEKVVKCLYYSLMCCDCTIS